MCGTSVWLCVSSLPHIPKGPAILPPRVLINGRFLTRPVTGVERYATETLLALDELLVDERLNPLGLKFEVVTPSCQTRDLKVNHLRLSSTCGRRTGHLWEQLELSKACRGQLLVNLCNTGPVFKSYQITAIHDAAVYSFPSNYSWKFRSWYKLMLPMLGRYSRRVVTVSEFSKSELQKHCAIKRSKVTVLSGAGDHMLRHEPDSSFLKHNGLQSNPFVLAVGSVKSSKNIDCLIEAMRRLNAPLSLVLVGGENLRVFSRIQTNPSQVISLRDVTDRQLRATYEAAECFVIPSLYEGFGLPAVEAMQLGCPVIASQIPSLVEVCRKGAIFCDPADPDSFANAIHRLVSDPKLSAKRRALGIEVSSQFRWQKTAMKLLELISATIETAL